MTSRYRVQLGSVQLDSLDENILILDVAYGQMEKTIKQYTTADLDGYDIHDIYYSRQTVIVTFELRIYDTALRNEALQKINAWAMNGGSLRVNDRKEQYLTVVCDQPAVMGSVRNWTDPLTIVFSTSYVPYWRSETQKVVNISGKNVRGTLKMDGNTGNALVSVNMTTAGAVTSLKITAGDTLLEFTDLDVPSGKSIVVDYVHSRYLCVKADEKSILSKLKPTSTDDLHVPCGQNTEVAIVSDGKINATFSGRGLWL